MKLIRPLIQFPDLHVPESHDAGGVLQPKRAFVELIIGHVNERKYPVPFL